MRQRGREWPFIAFPAPQPGGQVNQFLLRSRSSRGEHRRRQQRDVPAGAFDLDEIARAKRICARLSLRAACLPPLSRAPSSSRSSWLSSTR